MKLAQDQIKFAAEQINHIDSGEKGVFLDAVNTESQIELHLFEEEKMEGVFFSCLFYGNLRIHVAFEEDNDRYNEEVASLLKASLKKANATSCMLWLRNDNRRKIAFLKDTFPTVTDGAYDYASIEYIMRRENFGGHRWGKELDIRPFEESKLDDYLLLLDGAMTFASPPPNYRGNRDHMIQQLAERGNNHSFEAFWKGDNLVGLYWRKGNEIDTLAVSADHQRQGYGSLILTRALEMAFRNTDADYAYLYAVDWNEKGQAFYKKYGMEPNGHSYLLRINNFA